MSSPKSPETLVIFLKAPVEGLVKTRLARTTGHGNALAIYRHFVSDTLVSVAGNHHCTLCYYPEDKKKEVMEWLGTRHAYLPQQGHDLGERMKNAFLEAFSQGNQRVVVIGTDSPDLPPETVRKAFHTLHTKEAVIGPSKDGGYYLIGFQKEAFTDTVFENIPWSTETVFQRTVETLEKESLSYGLLPCWNDIDTWSDFTDFIARNAANETFIEKYRATVEQEPSKGETQ